MDISIHRAGYDRYEIQPHSPEGRRWVCSHMQNPPRGNVVAIGAEAMPQIIAEMKKDKLLVEE